MFSWTKKWLFLYHTTRFYCSSWPNFSEHPFVWLWTHTCLYKLFTTVLSFHCHFKSPVLLHLLHLLHPPLPYAAGETTFWRMKSFFPSNVQIPTVRTNIKRSREFIFHFAVTPNHTYRYRYIYRFFLVLYTSWQLWEQSVWWWDLWPCRQQGLI